MLNQGKSGGQRWLIPLLIALFAIVAVVGGHELASRGWFDEPNNVLFEADCSRVVENSTDLGGEQGRARVHPLHVLLIAPVGSLLAGLLGAQLVTILVTALAGAGLLYNVERILAEQLGLSTLDRALIVVLLGASASQVTFTMVPDTHLLSGFALSGMARSLTPDRVARLQEMNQSVWRWFKAGGTVPAAWSILAVGMLGTNLAAVAVLGYLVNPGRFWSRALRTACWTGATFACVLSLNMAQRAVWPPAPFREHVHVPRPRAPRPPIVIAAEAVGPHMTAFTPPPPADVRPAKLSVGHLGDYAKWVWTTNTRFMTPPKAYPRRIAELVPAFFGTAFLAPHLGLTPKPQADVLGLTFEPWDFDFRLPGVLGLALSVLVCARLLVATRGRLQSTAQPVSLFCSALVGGYLFIVGWYGDEAFLFSPNWVFAVVVLVASVYASAIHLQPRLQRPWRLGLACLVVLTLVNSALHVRDVFAYLT